MLTWLIDDIDYMMWRSLDPQPILSYSVSKQLAIRPGYCYELEDGTGSFKDFHSSRNNRFTFRKEADKIRIQHPSNILYFFNAPPDVTPEVFSKVRGRGSLAVCHLRRAWGLPKQAPAGSMHFRCNSWKRGRKKMILISDLQLCLALDRFVRRWAWSLLLMSTSLQERVSWFCHAFHFYFTATQS